MSPDNSSLRLELKNFYQAKLERLRKGNDANLDIVMTAQMRGQIKMVKDLLKNLEKPLGTLQPLP